MSSGRTYSYAVKAGLSVATNVLATAQTAVNTALTNIRAALSATLVPAPTGVAVAAVGTGGSFAAATFYWKVAAIVQTEGQLAESPASAEVSVAVALNGSANLSWNAVPGAEGYRVYRATAAAGEGTSPALVTEIANGATTTYTDTGTAVRVGAALAAASGAQHSVELSFPMAGGQVALSAAGPNALGVDGNLLLGEDDTESAASIVNQALAAINLAVVGVTPAVTVTLDVENGRPVLQQIG